MSSLQDMAVEKGLRMTSSLPVRGDIPASFLNRHFACPLKRRLLMRCLSHVCCQAVSCDSTGGMKEVIQDEVWASLSCGDSAALHNERLIIDKELFKP
jgi:hypothetical protein